MTNATTLKHRLSGGKLAVIAALSFGAMSALALDDDGTSAYCGKGAIAFYPFTDGEAGTSAVDLPLANNAKPGYFTGSATVSAESTYNPFAVFSADAPGKYILNGMRNDVIFSNPGSLQVGSDHKGWFSGSFTVPGLATEVSLHHANGHTIEFFYKLDNNKFKPHEASFKLSAGYQNNRELRIYAPFDAQVNTAVCCLNYYGDPITSNPYLAYMEYDDSPNDGNWHHVALVETTNMTIEAYYDYVRYGSFKITAVSKITESKPLEFFRNMIHGKLSCLRVTDHQLAPSEFLYAVERVPEFIDEPDVAAFYTFKDGHPGESATDFTLRNDAMPWLAPGETILSTTAGANPSAVFDDDAPGEEVYGGEEYPSEPFVRNPRSIAINSDVKGNSARISFTDIGEALYAAHGTGFSIEFFFKFIDSAIQEWDPALVMRCGYLNTAQKSADFQIVFPVNQDGAYCWYGFGYGLTTGMISAKLPAAPWDGKWHHFALVETPVINVGDPVTTNWNVTLYLDYRQLGNPYVIANINSTLPSKAFELCRDKHHCKYSCLKLTTRPLKRREFMRTSRRVPGFMFIVK